MYKLTESGIAKAKKYIKDLEAKRKEILDAGKDTINETPLISIRDIEEQIEFDFDEDDDEWFEFRFYCTDHYDTDFALWLCKDIDFKFFEYGKIKRKVTLRAIEEVTVVVEAETLDEIEEWVNHTTPYDVRTDYNIKESVSYDDDIEACDEDVTVDIVLN